MCPQGCGGSSPPFGTSYLHDATRTPTTSSAGPDHPALALTWSMASETFAMPACANQAMTVPPTKTPFPVPRSPRDTCGVIFKVTIAAEWQQ